MSIINLSLKLKIFNGSEYKIQNWILYQFKKSV
jgi:hypothetical protein